MQKQHFWLFVPVFALLALPTKSAVMVATTTDTNALAAALHPQGLKITAVSIEHGTNGQFGTYSNFNLFPITITNGVVLSSGKVSHVGDPPDPMVIDPQPSYEMNTIGGGLLPPVAGDSSPEFDAYGTGHIENFTADYDVAGLRVDFNLATNSQVKFDFIFGSVEYPYWTRQYTDALLVFLDGTGPTNQIAFDSNGQPVQVGLSFSGLVATNDQNTTFANPHGLLGKLTTTTTLLSAGNHTIRFEVGDVNDDFLDSAAFIANLRAESGITGTDLSDRPPPLLISGLRSRLGTNYLGLTWTNNGMAVLLESARNLTGSWTTVLAPWQTNMNWVSTTVTNISAMQFFRLHKQ